MNNTNSSSTAAAADSHDVPVEKGLAVFAILLGIFGLGIVAFCIYRQNRKIKAVYAKLKQPKPPSEYVDHWHDEDAERLVFAIHLQKARVSGGIKIDRWRNGPAGPVAITLSQTELQRIDGFIDAEGPIMLLSTKQAVYAHRPCQFPGRDRRTCTGSRAAPRAKPRGNSPPFIPSTGEQWELLPYDTENCSRSTELTLLSPSAATLVSVAANQPAIVPVPAQDPRRLLLPPPAAAVVSTPGPAVVVSPAAVARVQSSPLPPAEKEVLPDLT